MTKGLQQMFAHKPDTDGPAKHSVIGPESKKPGASSGSGGGYSPLETARLKLWKDATEPNSAEASEGSAAVVDEGAGGGASGSGGGSDGGGGDAANAGAVVAGAGGELPDEPSKTSAAVGGADDFVPCEFFDGPRPGFVFKSGDKGLGYYRDNVPQVIEITSTK
jgi:hypothetical protein